MASIQQNLAHAMQYNSQTRTQLGTVLSADTHDGTCQVRLSGGTVVTCQVPAGETVQYGAKVLLARLPGSTQLVVVSGSGSRTAPTATGSAVVAVQGTLAPHDLAGDMHLGTLLDWQAPQFLKHDGTRPLSGDLNANSHHVTGLADPANPTDAATKGYVDAHGL